MEEQETHRIGYEAGSVAEKAHDTAVRKSEALLQATIDSAAVAIRSLFLINGGAAVAILAFLSQVINLGESGLVTGVVDALLGFAIGVAAACAAACGNYGLNFLSASAVNNQQLTFFHPYAEETSASKQRAKAAKWAQYLTFLFAASSLALFLYGIFYLAITFRQL